jgi:hypothetical protein
MLGVPMSMSFLPTSSMREVWYVAPPSVVRASVSFEVSQKPELYVVNAAKVLPWLSTAESESENDQMRGPEMIVAGSKVLPRSLLRTSTYDWSKPNSSIAGNSVWMTPWESMLMLTDSIHGVF